MNHIAIFGQSGIAEMVKQGLRVSVLSINIAPKLIWGADPDPVVVGGSCNVLALQVTQQKAVWEDSKPFSAQKETHRGVVRPQFLQ